MPKYRTNKIKHEHTIIPGLRPVLEQMAACQGIRSIIPGPIRPHHLPRSVWVTIQYETETGLKLLGRNGSAIQEVFLVTGDPAEVRRWLVEQELAADRADLTEPAPSPSPPPRPGKQVELQFQQTCMVCQRTIAPGSRAIRIGQGGQNTYVHVRCAR